MASKEEFIDEGFSVVETEKSDNCLLNFIKDNCPQVIRDNEIKLDELKAVLGLHFDEKVNGYGLNFIGRNVARAKYAQKTAKELKINKTLSKNFDTTRNMVLKGDNIDCLKILKSYYSGRIKCIYIDPPYNTDSDEFIYPDKFDKEEAEVLGLANLSETDMARLELSFKTKKSHNGWLSFMYPRLLLARDLLANDGAIFISIDDHEQANLMLLCDDIFGEENVVGCIPRLSSAQRPAQEKYLAITHDYLIVYAKNKSFDFNNIIRRNLDNIKQDSIGRYFDGDTSPILASATQGYSQGGDYDFEVNGKVYAPIDSGGNRRRWLWTEERMAAAYKLGIIVETANTIRVQNYIDKEFQVGTNKMVTKSENLKLTTNDLMNSKYVNTVATDELKNLGLKQCFDFAKPILLLKSICELSTNKGDIILDFFAGSGTTAHAVMQLNAENEGESDGDGNRSFILCQIDEHIEEDKPAHAFCVENNLPPVISSIMIERLKRAGEKITEQHGSPNSADLGFKVFDTVDAPKLEIGENLETVFPHIYNDPLSRIYNMIFSIGKDNPASLPECIVENCTYKINDNYYITDADILDKEENKHVLVDAIKKGGVFIDGWTASINTTLRNYKKDVKIVI